ncbi:MAG: methionine--tRNA ligase, partial [Flavobacteriales bacterium]
MKKTTPERYLVTSALPYANGPLHIGQIAGAYLPADIYVRYLRLTGREVVYICGSDEHGAAITLRARKEGTSPKAIVDKYHEQIKETFDRFGMDFDIYHRTSSELHHQTASEFFKALYDKNEFTLSETEQYFDEEHKQFLADRYVSGTCPKCGYGSAYGDQCEKCGTSLSPKDLIDPKSTLSGKKPVKKKTSHWYLPLDRYEPWLRQWIVDGQKDKWKPNVYGQCKSWIDSGLHARAMTRDLDWGVPVPLPNAQGKVLYVWLDAPIGYISATRQWALDHNRKWEDYWKSEKCRLIHFIGKDNIVFHCIIFPILLKAHGEFILPYDVPANEFLNLEGDKISTSRNHAVWLHEYLDDFPGKQDELRYVLCSITPEAKDSEFTWMDYQSRINNELVAILGNFVHRTMVLTHKYFDGKTPANDGAGPQETELKKAIAKAPALLSGHLDRYHFRDALASVMALARAGNKYLADTEPWHVFKNDPKRVGGILFNALQTVANLSIMIKPFLPRTAQKIEDMLLIAPLKWQDAGSMHLLQTGHTVNPAALLFEKIEDSAIATQIEKLKNVKQTQETDAGHDTGTTPAPTFDDFSKLDIRVGVVTKAEKMENADKLLLLSVDTGDKIRTLVAGIATCYEAGELRG